MSEEHSGYWQKTRPMDVSPQTSSFRKIQRSRGDDSYYFLTSARQNPMSFSELLKSERPSSFEENYESVTNIGTDSIKLTPTPLLRHRSDEPLRYELRMSRPNESCNFLKRCNTWFIFVAVLLIIMNSTCFYLCVIRTHHHNTPDNPKGSNFTTLKKEMDTALANIRYLRSFIDGFYRITLTTMKNVTELSRNVTQLAKVLPTKKTPKIPEIKGKGQQSQKMEYKHLSYYSSNEELNRTVYN